jgi:hypothetical protein
MTLYVVKMKEIDSYNSHVYLIDAKNENHAKNLGEAKWYESNTPRIAEGETQVWLVEADYSGKENLNPSVRN